jgi:sensor histidine kinase YesM
MQELSLHILDIIQNSIAASADLISVEIEEDKGRDSLIISIRDNGRGIPREYLSRAVDPFYTSRQTRRVGLGLSLLQQAAMQSDGYLDISSEEGKGTEVRAFFKYSHIDRMPLGDIGKTMSVLIIGNPQINFVYFHRVAGDEFRFDTRAVRGELEGIPLNDPHVIGFIFQEFEAWMTRRNGMLRGGKR